MESALLGFRVSPHKTNNQYPRESFVDKFEICFCVQPLSFYHFPYYSAIRYIVHITFSMVQMNSSGKPEFGIIVVSGKTFHTTCYCCPPVPLCDEDEMGRNDGNGDGADASVDTRFEVRESGKAPRNWAGNVNKMNGSGAVFQVTGILGQSTDSSSSKPGCENEGSSWVSDYLTRIALGLE